MTNLFAWFTRPEASIKFAAAPFLAGSVFMLVSAILAAKTMKKDSFLNRKSTIDDEPLTPVH
jgi:DHA1 family tetracycline resistance protein-like MFS transporter